MKTITDKYGVIFEILYTLRKKGSAKNELTAPNMESILEYLAQRDRCRVEDITIKETDDERYTDTDRR